MLSFVSKIAFILLILLLLIIIIPNPVRNQFPEWLQKYQNYRDPQANHVLDLDQLELMSTDPLKCYKNADCVLALCGTTPNCHSIALNKEFYETRPDELPYQYQCPPESDLEPNDCGYQTQYDLFAACEDGRCVKKRLFPTPSPSGPGIVEKALYNSK